MPDIPTNHLAQLMDSCVEMQDKVHQLMTELALMCGFYRARVRDLTVGDEAGFGANEWKLLADIEESATPEGDGIIRLVFTDGTDHLCDGLDIVDVKAAPVLEPW